MRNFRNQILASVLLLTMLLFCGCAPADQTPAPEAPALSPDFEQKLDGTNPEDIVDTTPEGDVGAPDADAPDVGAPDVDTPDVDTPETDVPETPTPVPVPETPPAIVLQPEKAIDAPFCVIVDAGHGGSDPGAIVGDAYEAPINLAIALKLAAILEQNGVEVVLTRDTDKWVSLPDRHKLANEKNADLSISLHCNIYGADPDVSGLECYYRAEAPLGYAFAQRVLKAAKATGEIRTRSTRVEDYQMLVHPKMPSVLVEMGFMTCPEELQKLRSEAYQQTMAQALADAVLNTLNGK